MADSESALGTPLEAKIEVLEVEMDGRDHRLRSRLAGNDSGGSCGKLNLSLLQKGVRVLSQILSQGRLVIEFLKGRENVGITSHAQNRLKPLTSAGRSEADLGSCG